MLVLLALSNTIPHYEGSAAAQHYVESRLLVRNGSLQNGFTVQLWGKKKNNNNCSDRSEPVHVRFHNLIIRGKYHKFTLYKKIDVAPELHRTTENKVRVLFFMPQVVKKNHIVETPQKQ